jgi:hypothetical protein
MAGRSLAELGRRGDNMMVVVGRYGFGTSDNLLSLRLSAKLSARPEHLWCGGRLSAKHSIRAHFLSRSSGESEGLSTILLPSTIVQTMSAKTLSKKHTPK